MDLTWGPMNQIAKHIALATFKKHGNISEFFNRFISGMLEVDVNELKKLVNWHIEQGSRGLVPVGTTGESPTLTHAEHEQVVSEVINEADGRVPVMESYVRI